MTLSRRQAAAALAGAPLAAASVSACASGAGMLDRDAFAAGQEAIQVCLNTQKTAWNNGDIDGFMDFYWRDPRLVFISERSWTVGWAAALARYQTNYPNRAAMGTLDFTEITITMITPDDAYVWGRWSLQRAGDAPGGMFTLIWRRVDSAGAERRWCIVHDHTSA